MKNNTRMSFSSASFRNSRGKKRFSSGNRKKTPAFDTELLVRKAVPAETEPDYVPKHQFTDFAVDKRLKNNVLAKGYKNPTPIQDQAITHVLEGKDVVGIANTGTGKTAAFLVPLINKVIGEPRSKVLIIVPTRELAAQVNDELKIFAKGLNIYSALCIGGASINVQIKDLRRNPNFVIGTPGRLKDLDQRRNLNFSHYSTIVLDEVDRMLDMGFIHDIKHIINRLPQKRHSLFFSATLNDDAKYVMQSFLDKPILIKVKSDRTPNNIDQNIVKTNGKPKIEILHDLLIKEGFNKVLVFGRTKWGMEKLAKQLDKRGFNVASIHGNKSQVQRQRALKQFQENNVQALLATDVASRGLDIDDVTHVINFDLPNTYDDYIHRIGRTGRADKMGSALTLVE